MPSPVVPYETLIRLGVLGRRLDALRNQVSDLDEEVSDLIEGLAGSFESGEASDHFYEEWGRDIDRRLAADDV
jgi:hypothetical protein